MATKKQHKQHKQSTYQAETSDELLDLMCEALKSEEQAPQKTSEHPPELPLEVTLAALVNKYSTRAGLLYTSARYRRKMSHEEALTYVTQKEEAQDR